MRHKSCYIISFTQVILISDTPHILDYYIGVEDHPLKVLTAHHNKQTKIIYMYVISVSGVYEEKCNFETKESTIREDP